MYPPAELQALSASCTNSCLPPDTDIFWLVLNVVRNIYQHPLATLNAHKYVTRSRGMSHMLAIFNFDFSIQITCPFKCYILIQSSSQSDIWLQRYEQFFKFKNNVKHKNLSPLSGCNSKSIFPTSNSFPLIMSHIFLIRVGNNTGTKLILFMTSFKFHMPSPMVIYDILQMLYIWKGLIPPP